MQLSYNNIFDVIANDKSEAAVLKTSADLMLVMRDRFEFNRWTQSDVVSVLGITQSEAGDLMRGNIDKFSSDKLRGYMILVN